MKFLIPLPLSCPFVWILSVIITKFVREVRTHVKFLLVETVQTRLWKNWTLTQTYSIVCNLSSYFRYSLGRRKSGRSEIFGVWIIEWCFQWKISFFKGLLMSRKRLVPVNNSFTFIGEACNLFFMSIPNEGFVIVADGRFGTGYIVSVEWTHQ